jgi:hypothetical protein
MALSELESPDLVVVPGWEGALEIALRELPIAGQVAGVLGVWIPRVGQNPRFDDVVLFRVVRYMRGDIPARDQWIRATVLVAVATSDFSLIETLLLTLRERAHQFPDLVRTATAIGSDSAQMRSVLRNACGIVLPAGPSSV